MWKYYPISNRNTLLSALRHALEYYQGAPQALKVDNLRSAVTKADRYEPTFNELMDEFAQYYHTTAITARVGKPRDKPSVESSVRIVYQAIYAKLQMGNTSVLLSSMQRLDRCSINSIKSQCKARTIAAKSCSMVKRRRH